MPLQITGFVHRAGTSYARGTDIDALLPQEDVSALYAGWKREWPEPLEFHGGERSITCEMVLEVPVKELIATYKKPMTKRLLEVAQQNAGW